MPSEGAPTRVGVLVIRAWVEPGRRTLVARVTGRQDVEAEEETTVTVTGSEAALAVASDWLAAFERS